MYSQSFFLCIEWGRAKTPGRLFFCCLCTIGETSLHVLLQQKLEELSQRERLAPLSCFQKRYPHLEDFVLPLVLGTTLIWTFFQGDSGHQYTQRGKSPLGRRANPISLNPNLGKGLLLEIHFNDI